MLEPSADEIRDWGNSVTQFMIEYLGGLRDRPVYRHTSSREIRSGLDSKLPIKGTDFDSLLKVFRDTIVPFSRQNAHPRMFGYVQSPGTPIGAFADLLASTLNANLTIWRSAPAPVELERLTIDWIRQILGFNPEAGGLFVSGGSMANLAALAAARQTKYDSLGRLRMYASSATHFSITKAAALWELAGRTCSTSRSTNASECGWTILLQKSLLIWRPAMFHSASLGMPEPWIPARSIPLREIREVANRFQLWMHVDGSYGAFAILAQSARKLFAGMEQADSIALDPHKWLYLPVDVGCVIYRNPEIARATFAHEAEYTRMFGEEADEAFVCWDYGPELSRRFRALKVWMLLKGVGSRSVERGDRKQSCVCAPSRVDGASQR